eukprot:6994403-Ditylum_brightwellii.AAC.1
MLKNKKSMKKMKSKMKNLKMVKLMLRIKTIIAMKSLPKRSTNIMNIEQMDEETLYNTSEAGGNTEKTSNLNNSPHKLDSNTGMESNIRKEEEPKMHSANKEDSTTNDSSYYDPTLHKEEITSIYSEYSGLKLNSSDVEIVMKSST